MKFIFIASFFLLTACQDKIITAPSNTVRSGIPIIQGDIQASLPRLPYKEPPLGYWGDVRCHSSQHKNFNQQVKNFLSTSFDPNQARYTIKCSKTDHRLKGGFFIWGKIFFDGQKFDPLSQSQNLTVSSNSHLAIHIVDITGHFQTKTETPIKTNNDSYASMIQMKIPDLKDTKTTETPIRINIDRSASIIRGQNASLVFKDTKRKIFMKGSISSNTYNQLVFTGQFDFQNFRTWSGSSPGYQGSIGTFRIVACRFFDCQEQEDISIRSTPFDQSTNSGRRKTRSRENSSKSSRN